MLRFGRGCKSSQRVGHFEHRRRPARVVVRTVEDPILTGLRQPHVIVMRTQDHIGVFKPRVRAAQNPRDVP